MNFQSGRCIKGCWPNLFDSFCEIKITGKKIQLIKCYNSWIEFCEINALKPNDFLNALKISFKIHDKKFNN